jgi:signal transduction histidine kinase
VAGVAHELNNPISNAGTSAQILLEEMRETDALPQKFLQEMLEQIAEQTDRARSIVRSLLEFSREKSVNPEMVKVSDILHQTLDLVRGEIPTSVEVSIHVERDGSFLADKQRLQQALVNLLLNAFHALEGGESATIFLRGSVDESGGKVRLEVEDNGPGIPPEIKKKIFDPFFTTKDVGDGSGLGLAITREIIDKHGGDITVESDDHSGARFIISLPLETTASMEPDL